MIWIDSTVFRHTELLKKIISVENAVVEIWICYQCSIWYRIGYFAMLCVKYLMLENLRNDFNETVPTYITRKNLGQICSNFYDRHDFEIYLNPWNGSQSSFMLPKTIYHSIRTLVIAKEDGKKLPFWCYHSGRTSYS
jgi:hypothetical protein